MHNEIIAPRAYIVCSLCGERHRLIPASNDPTRDWNAPIYASCGGFLRALKAGDEVEYEEESVKEIFQ